MLAINFIFRGRK